MTDEAIAIEESEFLGWWNSLSEEEQEKVSRNKLIEQRGFVDSGKAEEEEERSEKFEEELEGNMSQEENDENKLEQGRENGVDTFYENIKGKGERAAEEREVEREAGRDGVLGDRAKAAKKALDY